jgi:ABC-2 type transport system ATP-binding protein
LAAVTPLVVEGLTKRFGEVRALEAVSFSVAPGEVFGYLGPNGAGKTTTLRVILGLVRPSAGSVRIFGAPAPDPATRAHVGFLPGDLELYGDLKGSSLLDYFARFRGAEPPALRGELLERLAVDPSVLKRRVKFLSHGTRQKLGLIIALQHDPALVLLDEPSSGLDPLMQQALRELIRDFARRGRAVLFSSHILNEVEDICGRVAILRAGELVALESIENLRANVVRRLRVRFRGQVPQRLIELPEVKKSEVSGSQVELWLRGDLNPLLRVVSGERVVDLVFPEPELEDIFLSYYRDDPKNG